MEWKWKECWEGRHWLAGKVGIEMVCFSNKIHWSFNRHEDSSWSRKPRIEVLAEKTAWKRSIEFVPSISFFAISWRGREKGSCGFRLSEITTRWCRRRTRTIRVLLRESPFFNPLVLISVWASRGTLDIRRLEKLTKYHFLMRGSLLEYIACIYKPSCRI
jgi:hypothetical protein